MAIEQVCQKLYYQDVEQLRSSINRVLRSSHPPKPNISKTKFKAIYEFKNDKSRIFHTKDKMVAMSKQDYIRKVKNLLEQPTYRPLPSDPTNKHKVKLMNILKRMKMESGMTGPCSP